MSQPPPSRPEHPRRCPAPAVGRPVRRRVAVPLLLAAGVALIVALLILHDDARYYRGTSGSMQPTLAAGSRVAAQAGLQLKIGEIVDFHPPQGAIPAVPVCGTSDEGATFPQPC